MSSSKDVPIYCPDPIMPVYTYNWDSFVPPNYTQMKWIPVTDTTATTTATSAAPAPTTAPATKVAATTASTTSPATTGSAAAVAAVASVAAVATSAAAPTAAEPSICHHGGVHYWNPPSIW